jgi:hypothetical protein
MQAGKRFPSDSERSEVRGPDKPFLSQMLDYAAFYLVHSTEVITKRRHLLISADVLEIASRPQEKP